MSDLKRITPEEVKADLPNIGDLRAFVEQQDAILARRSSYVPGTLASHFDALMTFNRVEVGYRASCGTVDPTMHTHRAWVKVVKRLRKAGFTVSEEPVKHGNGWATVGRGFWSSVIYRLSNH